jgi:endo-1,4-beta-mannosidase
MEDDLVRQLLTAAFVCELSAGFGKPVVLEEFGVTSDFSSDDHAAEYYRQVLHTTLLAGATGWLAWNNCDYDDLRDEDPYRHHPFEMHFGLTDRNGAPKPQLEELASFSRLVRELAVDGWEPVKGDVAIVVPEHFERALPFTSDAYRDDLRHVLLQSYVAAREADLPVALLRERDGLAGGSSLYLLPCAKLLTAPGLGRLRDLATDGATVYLSYFAGSTSNQRGPWIAWLDELFGVEHRLRYGLVDPIDDDEVVLELVRDFGDLEEGARLSFHAGGEPGARSYLPVEATSAEVIAVDGYGRPALLEHRLGTGRMVLCTYPLEHMAARTASVNPESTWRLYSALAHLAGVSRPVSVADPRVLVGILRQPHGDTTMFVNCSADTVVVEPTLAADARTALSPTPFALGPLQVAVARAGNGLGSTTQPDRPVAETTASREGSDALGSG